MKLSIISINRNNAEGLEKTIKSVIEQTFTDFEYIIIDGNSTDTSTEIIKKYESKIHYWVSEPDTGIYNAMNKGIKQATGEYCLFLNSGDNLCNNGILESCLEFLGIEAICYGDLIAKDIDGYKSLTYPDLLTAGYFWGCTLGHPGSFIKLELLQKAQGYDETIKISSDHDFFLRAICNFNASYKHIPIIVSEFQMEGISSKPENQQSIKQELLHSFKKNLPLYYEDYLKLHEINEDSLAMFYLKYRNNNILQFLLKIIRKLFTILKIQA